MEDWRSVWLSEVLPHPIQCLIRALGEKSLALPLKLTSLGVVHSL